MNRDFILYSIATMLGYFNMVWIYGIISKQKFKIKIYKLLLIMFFGAFNTFISFRCHVLTKTLYNIVVYFLLTKLFYNNEKRQWCFYTLFVWLIGGVLDVISMSIVSMLLVKIFSKITTVITVVSTIILQVFHNFLFRIRYVGILAKKLYEKIQLVENIVWFYVIIVFLFIVFGILAFMNMSDFTNEVLSLFLVILCLSVSIYFVHTISIEKIYNETSKNLLENNSYYIDQNTKNRIFKHNIIHKLDGINSIANEKTKKLINDLINEYNLLNAANKEIDNLPNGINGLICKKVYSNKGKKIEFAINNYIKSELFDVLSPKNYNKLCETLGICLDNAIMATLKSKEKILQIAILENAETIFIKIVNTFKSELEIDEIGNLNYTTKNNGHGLGLYSIFSKKDVKIKTSIINNLFENQIIVKKKKIKL